MIRLLVLLAVIVLLIVGVSYIDSIFAPIFVKGFGYEIEAIPSLTIVAVVIITMSVYFLVRIAVNLLSLPWYLSKCLKDSKIKSNNKILIESLVCLLQNNKEQAIDRLKNLNVSDNKNIEELRTIIHATKNGNIDAIKILKTTDKNYKVLIDYILAGGVLPKENRKPDINILIHYFEELPNKSSALFLVKGLLEAGETEKLFEIANTRKFKAIFKGKADKITCLIGILHAQELFERRLYVKTIDVLNNMPITVEGISIHLQALINTADYRGAINFLKSFWSKFATPETATQAFELVKFLNEEKFYELAKKLYNGSIPSKILLAKASLLYEKYSDAGKYISELVSDQNPYANLLMVEYCIRTHSSKGEVVEWLSRAQIMLPDIVHLSHIKEQNLKNLEKLLDS